MAEIHPLIQRSHRNLPEIRLPSVSIIHDLRCFSTTVCLKFRLILLQGSESGHPGREVRVRLHLVRRRHSELDQNRRRLRVGGSVVQGHSDCREPGRRAGIRGEDGVRGTDR